MYAGTLSLPADLSGIVAATEGVTASYIKELLRRAVLAAMPTAEVLEVLEPGHFATALAEMSAEREALTRSLLGDGSRSGDEPEPGPEPGPPGPPMPPGMARAFMMAMRTGRFYGRLP